MLAIPPSSFTTHGGRLSENPLINDQWTGGGGYRESEPFVQFSSFQSAHHVKLESCSPPSGSGGRGGSGGSGSLAAVAKKLKHNASERDRRKKINSLYSYLRCLLPSTNRTKRMSNPTTISRALKYIPELQQQVEELRRRKQELMEKINATNDDDEEQKKIISLKKHYIIKPTITWMNSLCVIVNWLSETQALLQITSDETLKLIPFSQILHSLEEDELLLLTSSSFQSFDGRLFFTLLLQMKANTPSKSRLLQEILNKRCSHCRGEN